MYKGAGNGDRATLKKSDSAGRSVARIMIGTVRVARQVRKTRQPNIFKSNGARNHGSRNQEAGNAKANFTIQKRLWNRWVRKGQKDPAESE